MKTMKVHLPKLAFIAAILVLAGGLSGCRTNGGTGAFDLEGTAWVLTHFEEEVLPGTFVAREPISLRFSSGETTLGGFSGCNRYGAAYERNGSQLRIADVWSTRMACPDMEWETRFLQELQKATDFRLRDGRLVLLTDGRALLQFAPAMDKG